MKSLHVKLLPIGLKTHSFLVHITLQCLFAVFSDVVMGALQQAGQAGPGTHGFLLCCPGTKIHI